MDNTSSSNPAHPQGGDGRIVETNAHINFA